MKKTIALLALVVSFQASAVDLFGVVADSEKIVATYSDAGTIGTKSGEWSSTVTKARDALLAAVESDHVQTYTAITDPEKGGDIVDGDTRLGDTSATPSKVLAAKNALHAAVLADLQ